ncbi:MAG: hypothetical protein LBI04_06370 [Treponema sp.]|jgi:hypothetical protein|nr:hypothetical protein [Treponema sp.]
MKSVIKTLSFLFILCSLLIVTTCSLPDEATGTFSITIGGSGSRKLLDWDSSVNSDQLTHIITLSAQGSEQGGPQSKTIPAGGGTATFSVVPGTWIITVEGRQDGANGALKSYAEKTINVNAGKNDTVRITMGEPPKPPKIDQNITVSTTADWDAAIDIIKNGGGNINYIIELTGNFTVPGSTAYTFGNVSDINVTLTGNQTLTLSSPGNLLRLYGNQNVILQDAKLKGYYSNNTAIVDMSYTSGTFTMNGSSSISNNTSGYSGAGVYMSGSSVTFIMNDTASISANYASGSYVKGGGVYMSGGTFTMNDTALISNNNAHSGSGAYVTGGTFTMNGSASISNNTASGYFGGGGVYVEGSTAFNMTGGTISGNRANNSAENGGSGGAGVYVYSGTFTMTGGKIVSNSVSDGYGGGVYVYSGTLTINSPAVPEDIAGNNLGSPYLSLRNVCWSSSGGGIVTIDGVVFTSTGW